MIDTEAIAEIVQQSNAAIEPAEKMVRSGGIVTFHDILPFNDGCQVRPVWERLKTEHRYAEFKLGSASTGLGVLFL